jgi:hypothetical protein
MAVGFTVYYRSTVPVDVGVANRIRTAIQKANKGRTWLSCEPVCLFEDQEDGHLFGGSKPNFAPHPDDIAAAEREDLPDGTINDVLQILCDVSETHGVDWEISHDELPGPIGFVRNGIPDPELIGQIEAFAGICGSLGDLESWFTENDATPDPDSDSENDDDGPSIIRLWPDDM